MKATVHEGLLPVQERVAPLWEYVLQPLAEAGVYRGVFADIPMTQAAVYSDRTAAVHLTGASQTYDAILYGSGVRHHLRTCPMGSRAEFFGQTP